MRKLYLVIIAIAVLFVVTGGARANPEVDKKDWTDQQWKEYDKEAAKGETDAGGETEIVPVHKRACKPGQYCPTIENGISAGKKWCVNVKNKKLKCAKTHRNRTYQLYLEWGAWLELYNGGRLAVHMANTMRTESEGDPSSKTISTIREVGLMSIKAATARRLDIDACHPEANIWAAGYVSNEQRIKLAKKYPQVKLAPREDWEKLAGGGGAVGAHRVHNLIDASGALRIKKGKGDEEEKLFYKSPYDRVLKWMGWKARTEGDAAYGFAWMHVFGRIPGLTSFRVSRSDAAYTIIGEYYPDGFPWEPHETISRPEHLPPYPGDKLHGKCHIVKEWRELRPSSEEVEKWKADNSMPKKPDTMK